MFEAKISDQEINKNNQRYINDLIKILKTHSTIPEHTPNKLLDCFWLYKDGDTYRLYIYINNEWKYSALT